MTRQEAEAGGGGGGGGNPQGGRVRQASRSFITAPVMITYPVAYSLANILWTLSGFFGKGLAASPVMGIVATLIVSVGILALDLGTAEEAEERDRLLKGLYFVFNFLLLAGGVLHIEVPTLTGAVATTGTIIAGFFALGFFR